MSVVKIGGGIIQYWGVIVADTETINYESYCTIVRGLFTVQEIKNFQSNWSWKINIECMAKIVAYGQL